MAEIRKRRSRRANGEGTITRRKDGLWQAAIYVPHPDGTVRRRYLYNRDRDRLREELNELAYTVGKGIPVPDGSVTVGEYLDQWLAEVAAKQVRAATYTGYETNVRLHIKPLIGSKKLAKLTARDVRQMVEALRTKPLSRGTGIMSDRAVQYVHATLRAALEQACREELIPRNVAKLVQASVRDAKQHDPYSSEESKQLLAQAEKHRLYALWVLLVMLGMRRGEALALRWADVDLDAGTVAVLGSLQRVGSQLQRVPTKTRGSLRTIPLPAPCVEALRSHRARQNSDRLAAGARWVAMDLVFTTRHGTPVEPRTVNRMFRSLTDAADLRPVRVHDLRHGCVSLLLSLGVPPRTVMQIVGHTVMEMTMERYGHVNLGDQREALNLLDQELR
jgi:integrase